VKPLSGRGSVPPPPGLPLAAPLACPYLSEVVEVVLAVDPAERRSCVDTVRLVANRYRFHVRPVAVVERAFEQLQHQVAKEFRRWAASQRWAHATFIPGIFLGEGFPPKKLAYPKTAAKLCALNRFFLGRDNELQLHHGNILLMDNKHRKLFVIKQ